MRDHENGRFCPPTSPNYSTKPFGALVYINGGSQDPELIGGYVETSEVAVEIAETYINGREIGYIIDNLNYWG